MFAESFLLESEEILTYGQDAGLFSSSECISPAVSITQVTFKDAAFDGFYMTQDASTSIREWDGVLPEEWTWKTVLVSDFNGNLMGGSVEYSANNVSEIRIKKRKAGTFKWQTIYIQPVSSYRDFEFNFYDIINASNTKYEYGFVPLINGIEGPISFANELDHDPEREGENPYVLSKFSDAFICNTDQTFHAILNFKNDITYNQETAVQTTINRKRPFVIKNGMVGYYTGSMEVTWIELKDCEWDVEGGAIYRQQIDDFLTDGRPKIIKDWQGNIYMASIVNAIPQNAGDYVYTPVHQIEWVECGDVDSIADLYDNGFIDTDMDRE